MISNIFKSVIIVSVALISACSGTSTSTCFSEGCQSFDGRTTNNANKVSFGGSGLGSSFSQYSSGLLHDD